MTMTIDAVYEAGVFRPLEQMDLTEGRHVKLTVDAEEAAFALPLGPDASRATALTREPGNENETDAETQARLEIVQAITALAVSHGRVETASRDHDKFLYGSEGAR